MSVERYGVIIIMRTWPAQGRTSPTGRAGFSSDAAAALIARRAVPQLAPEQVQVIADDAGDHSGGGGGHGGGDDDDDGSPARMSFRRSNRGHTSVEAVDVVNVKGTTYMPVRI